MLCQICTEPCTKKTRGYTNGSRDYWSCNSCNFFCWDDKKGSLDSQPGPPCKCPMKVPSRLAVSRTAANPDRPFWTCASSSQSRCGFFEWASEDFTPPPQHPAGGLVDGHASSLKAAAEACKKCKESVQHKVVSQSNQNGNAGRTYYNCSKCKHFEWVTSAPPAPLPTPATPGSVEHLVDIATKKALQKLFEVPADAELGVGRDVTASREPYDHLRVECAWRVTNPNRRKRYEEFVTRKLGHPADGSPSTFIPRQEHAAAVSELLASPCFSPLASAAAPGTSSDGVGGRETLREGEYLLLHGTKPELLFPILFEGLDPTVAKDGLFGRGTYFAEAAGKVDQYMTVDKEWKGGAGHTDDTLHKLHQKLYKFGIKHAQDVYYALVCRVALGNPSVTQDGSTEIASPCPSQASAAGSGSSSTGARRRLFVDDSNKSVLTSGGHSLLAETGGQVQRYREIIVFDPAAIDIEFLVALKREKHYCGCGVPVKKRSVSKEGDNLGRDFLCCERDKCSFKMMFPLCCCGVSAGVGYKKDGDGYYRCGRYGRCDFKDWKWKGTPGRSAGPSTPAQGTKRRRF